MKLLKTILLGTSILWSANLFAFCVHNDLDEPIHFRIHGPSEAKYYSKIAPQQHVCKDVNHHVGLYIYFRRYYDWLVPFSPGLHDNICSESKGLLGHWDHPVQVSANAHVYVSEQNGKFNCRYTSK